MVRRPIDKTHEITLTHSIELPFWIPVKSGRYRLPKNKKIKVRNELWLVSIANIVDDPLNLPYEFIVDKTQVSDREYLERITEGRAKYFHKRKMKSTITRNLVLLPFEGVFSAEAESDAWRERVQGAVLNSSPMSVIQRSLDEANEIVRHTLNLAGYLNKLEKSRGII